MASRTFLVNQRAHRDKLFNHASGESIQISSLPTKPPTRPLRMFLDVFSIRVLCLLLGVPNSKHKTLIYKTFFLDFEINIVKKKMDFEADPDSKYKTLI